MSVLRHTHLHTTAGAALLLPIVLAGCTAGPNYQPPAAPTAQAYTAEAQPAATTGAPGKAGTTQRFGSTDDLPSQWWHLFESPQLDQMVRTALEGSPTLVQASARLTQAREQFNSTTGATRYPTVNANLSGQREQVNLSTFGVPQDNPPPFNLFNGSVSISYVLDLFGGNRRLIEGLNAQVDYQRWQLQGARLMLAGNVVTAAIRQAQLRAQVDIVTQMVALEKQTLAITEQRVRAGGVSQYDLRSQQVMVAQTEATLPGLQNQLDAVNHQLAVLMGQLPADSTVKEVRLDQLNLPETLPVSVPSAFVRQRPDILAAEKLLHRASANVGVATANLYPQIELSASAGLVSTDFSGFGPIWNFGGQLAQPIFKGGSLQAEKRKAIAAYEEAGGAYRQTVLQAFREVADVLRAIDHDATTLQLRSDAAAKAQDASEIAARLYHAGGISQIALLDAQRQQLQTALDEVDAQAARYADSATLFQALGGGWWNEAPSTRPAD